MKPVDITAVVTFHREGLMAHRSLTSVVKCCQYAQLAGMTTRIVATLDDADLGTKRVIQRHPGLGPNDEVIELSLGDAALSRNHAIRESDSRYISIFDGDDCVSRNWLAAAMYKAVRMDGPSIIHPRLVIAFGAITQFRKQPDQSRSEVDERGLLMTNFWNVCSFADRDTYVAIPYVPVGKGGFGFEDWHWNCETVAAGFQHVTAPKTVYFERHKKFGSVNLSHQLTGAVVRSSNLFRRAK